MRNKDGSAQIGTSKLHKGGHPDRHICQQVFYFSHRPYPHGSLFKAGCKNLTESSFRRPPIACKS
jgi:hypothetical protein